MWDGCGWGWGWGSHGWGMGLMGVVWLLLVVVLVAVAVRWAMPALRAAPSADLPLDVLKKRYARGEINAEEFDRIKRGIE